MKLKPITRRAIHQLGIAVKNSRAVDGNFSMSVTATVAISIFIIDIRIEMIDISSLFSYVKAVQITIL